MERTVPMHDSLIIFRSVTHAQRAAETLRQFGVPAAVLRTPRSLSKTGCSYALNVSRTDLDRAMPLLRWAGLENRGVYSRTGDGAWEVEP